MLGTTRVGVTVTFLRQEKQPPPIQITLPPDAAIVRVPAPTVGFYRYLYDSVGAAHVWWLRRTMPKDQLSALIRAPGVSIHVLYKGNEPAGFFELDARAIRTVNLSYFGLFPHAIGAGLGTTLLHVAMALAWAHKPAALTVNTCTADHPRALPNYIRAGFVPVRAAREIWDVPNHLGLLIPDHLRI